MSLFEAKTGKFLPLNRSQIATLNDQQRTAYDSLVAAVDELTAANAEADDARAANQAAVKRLDAAQLADSQKSKWSALDEWKASLRIRKPVSVVEEQLSDVQPAQTALTESQIWMQSAAERQSTARGALGLATQKWQVATGAAQTPGELIKQHLEQQNAERAERVAAGRPPQQTGRPGPSQIDQFAFYTKANGRRAGGGRGFARGGVSQMEALRRNAERVAASIRQKLPSER